MTTSPVNRTLLFTAPPGQDAPRVIDAEMSRLNALYLKARTKKLSSDVLYISVGGEMFRPVMGITAYTTPDQSPDLAFLLANVSQPTAARPLAA